MWPAREACAALLGPYTLLQRTGEEPLQGSILRISLPTTWLCGRTITTTEAVITPLINAFESTYATPIRPLPATGITGGANLEEVASNLLVKAGGPAIAPLLGVARNQHIDPDLRIGVIRLLARFVAGENSDLGTDDFLSLFPGLARVIDDGDDLQAYEAERAFAPYYGAATMALAVKASLSQERYAELLYAVSQQHKLDSSYAVDFREIEEVLTSTDSLTQDFALAAARARTLAPAEFATLLPRLGELANPSPEWRQATALELLATQPSAAVAPYLVRAVDPTLLGAFPSEAFLFDAMKALRAVATFPEAALAVPALQQIAASTVNPDNHYLQIIATELLQSIAGAR